MTRLSEKDVRPSTSKPCFNAKDGCPNQTTIGAPGDVCNPCRRGRPIPPKPVDGFAIDEEAA